MESGALTPGAGVGFIKPTKRKLAKATAVKRVFGKSLFSKGHRSSLTVKAGVVEYTRSCSSSGTGELSNSRQNEDKNDVQVVADHGSDMSATELEPSASVR